MTTTNRLSHRQFETIANDRPLTAAELAALDIAARPLSKCRAELNPGDHKVWLKVLISGGLTVRQPVTAATPADVLGVIAWILARLPDKARVSVANAVNAGETLAMGKSERDAAKALCEPTRGSTVRSGAISGTIAVDIVR